MGEERRVGIILGLSAGLGLEVARAAVRLCYASRWTLWSDVAASFEIVELSADTDE